MNYPESESLGLKLKTDIVLGKMVIIPSGVFSHQPIEANRV